MMASQANFRLESSEGGCCPNLTSGNQIIPRHSIKAIATIIAAARTALSFIRYSRDCYYANPAV